MFGFTCLQNLIKGVNDATVDSPLYLELGSKDFEAKANLTKPQLTPK